VWLNSFATVAAELPTRSTRLQFLARDAEVPRPVFHLMRFMHVDLAAIGLTAFREVVRHVRYSESRLVAVS
jgi:hypothetical protein